MRDSFGDGEEAMNVVCSRKKLARDVPRGRARFRHELDDFPLPFRDGAQVTIEQFLEIGHYIAVPAVDECRREAAYPGETH